MRRHPIAIAITSLLLTSTALAKDAVVTTPDDQKSLAITIYNSNLALVKDQREVSLPKGEFALELAGVSAQIKPETALLRNTKAEGAITVLEQNFDFDLLTPAKLLDKSVGKTLALIKTHPESGEQTSHKAKILATNAGVVAEVDGKIMTNPEGQYVFDSLPNNLRAAPTLTTQVANSRSGKTDLELSYLTNGLSWKADYVAELTDNTLALASWVTLNNHSQVDYNNATVQLVAGDVNQVQERPEMHAMAVMKSKREMIFEDTAVENIGEYKLYTLPRKTTIANAQTKQVALFNASGVKVKEHLIFEWAPIGRYTQQSTLEDRSKARVELAMTNDKAHNLGLAMPKGIVRVYQKDSQGRAQFIGEDRLEHTAEGEKIKLNLGSSFDVSATRTQTAFKHLPKLGNHTRTNTAYNIEINNAKDKPVTVLLREQFADEWEMGNASEPYKKLNASTVQWELTIPAKSKKTLSFDATVKY